MKAQGAQHIQLFYAQFVRQLRKDAGTESIRRAGELVRDQVSDRQEQSSTVHRFLDDLERWPCRGGGPRGSGHHENARTSRKALCTLVDRFDEVAPHLRTGIV